MTSTACRRVARLEGALNPREAGLAWLVEAQQYPSLVDHVRSIAGLPVEAAPLSVIGDRVEAAVRADRRGQPRDAIETAVRRAVGDAVFLFSLALGLNVVALEIARLEGLRATAVFFWMGCLLGGPRESDLPPADVETYRRERADAWGLWWPVVDRLSLEVQIETAARVMIEARFFATKSSSRTPPRRGPRTSTWSSAWRASPKLWRRPAGRWPGRTARPEPRAGR